MGAKKLNIETYDAKVDSKKRIIIKNAKADYYNVEAHEDGTIILKPRILVSPVICSETLSMIDKAMDNLEKGNKPKHSFNPKKFPELLDEEDND